MIPNGVPKDGNSMSNPTDHSFSNNIDRDRKRSLQQGVQFSLNSAAGTEQNNGAAPTQNPLQPLHPSSTPEMAYHNSRRRSSAQSLQGFHSRWGIKNWNPLLASFRHLKVRERLPKIENYALNASSALGLKKAERPSMRDLLGGWSSTASVASLAVAPWATSTDGSQDFQETGSIDLEEQSGTKKENAEAGGSKFGWVKGVLIRCFLNILGVMLFMRLSWITGQAGIGLATVIILLSSCVSFLTALSMCAICTNGEVKGGGVYFMISRSLGPPFGGAIGIVFALANALAVGMHVVGFAETVKDLIKGHDAVIVDNDTNDIRIVGIATVFLLLVICLISMEFEAMMQVGLMVILTASLINYAVGTVLPVRVQDAAKGITGYNKQTLVDNFLPNYRGDYDFISLFSIFFPSVTGIAAGANISGDLKNPQTAIPKGTLLAILLTDLIYVAVVWMTGSTCIRDASGNVEEYLFGNYTECKGNTSCDYGLMNYYQVLEIESGFGPLITAGIFAATLSSALACLVSAPKIFQAVCNDEIFPYIKPLAKGYGKNQEPKRSYILAFVIAVCLILIGDLNVIAPIISNFYLAAYALVNYACFDATLSKSPGFRPSFKYFNLYVALLGGVLCVAVQFIMNWYYALLTDAVVAVLYAYIYRKKSDINWGSSTDANMYKDALKLVLKLQGTTEHIKTYRPQLLVLTGNPCHRPSLVDFAGSITKDTSLLICGHVITSCDPDELSQQVKVVDVHREYLPRWLRSRGAKAFYAPVVAPSLQEGVRMLIQTQGLSKLRPNVVLIGFKNNWRKAPLEDIQSYYNIIVDTFEVRMGVVIFRLGHGLDFSDLLDQYQLADILQFPLSSFLEPNSNDNSVDTARNTPSPVQEKEDSGFDPNESKKSSESVKPKQKPIDKFRERISKIAEGLQHKTKEVDSFISRRYLELDHLRAKSSNPDLIMDEAELAADQKEVLSAVNHFQVKQKKAFIDVWWLYDDGGLTLLIPYLLGLQKSCYVSPRLRVFTLSQSRRTLAEDQEGIKTLLQKFRIEAVEVVVIPDIVKLPTSESLGAFDKMISKFIIPSRSTNAEGSHVDGVNQALVTEDELQKMIHETYLVLRTRELVAQYSMEARLIVLTLPVPQKDTCPATLYLAWLDFLTRGLPPALLVRGNQQSVLTFYS